jgi:hypothetical protein
MPKNNGSHEHLDITVEVFRTSVTTIEKAEFLLEKLQREFPSCDINFDLEDCDHILRVATKHNRIDPSHILRLVKSHNESIEPLPDIVPTKIESRQ